MNTVNRLAVAVLIIGLVATWTAQSFAQPEWDSLYRDAETSFQQGRFDEAGGKARQALERAKELFGGEDVRTYGSEYLMLMIEAYQKSIAGDKTDEELNQRMVVLAEKAVTKRRKVYNMTWHYGEPAKEWPSSKHIIMTFVDYPNHHVGMYSPDLANYLDSLAEKQVPVAFEVTYTPLGEMQGYHEVQIGALTHWKSEWGYGGTQDDYKPSPWETP